MTLTFQRLLRAIGRVPNHAVDALLTVALSARHQDQLRRYARLRSWFAQIYGDLGGVRDETPHWESFNRDYERFLLPRPPLGLLREPLLRSQMFVDDRYLRHQIPALMAHFGRHRLLELSMESPVGLPRLFLLNGRTITSTNTIHMLYHWSHFERESSRSVWDIGRVVEWGGGYGNVARLYWNATGRGTYIIIDTPLMSCVQWLYLSAVIGAENTQMVAEGQRISEGKLNLVPVHLVDSVDLSADLFYSTWALDESPLSAQRMVLDRDWFGAKHLLLATSTMAPSRESDYRGEANDQELVDAAKNWGATETPVPFLASSRYLVR